MNNTVKSIFESINSLDDIQRQVSESEDGESSWLEFKAIKKQGDPNKDFIKHQKSLLAKEICAFLNTSDGIIAWGVECDNGKLTIANECAENLYDLFDKFIQTIVQPSPKGIESKHIKNGDNEFLLIYIPKSDFLPHRVWGNADSDFRRNYYARSGTNSMPLDEGLIRSLYLSEGRVPRISIYTEPYLESYGCIALNVYSNPDNAFFVDRYYDCEEFILLDGVGNRIEIEEDGGLWTELSYLGHRSSYPIYPSDRPIRLFSNYITISDAPERGDFADGLMNVTSDLLNEDIKLSREDYHRIKFIFTRSQFACDKVPLIINRRLYVIGSMMYGVGNEAESDKKGFSFRRSALLEKLERKYNIEVFVMETYADDEIIDDLDDGALQIPNQDNLPLSWLDSIINHYAGNLE